jgi:hypothetical protein
MTTGTSTLLGLALPVTGELSGTWGDTVNDSITSLLDSAVAGTTTLSTDADVTLTTTTLAANQSRQAILLWTAGGTVTRTITAPAQSKVYAVINKTSSTQSIKLVGVGPTTGITIDANEKCVAAWNGSDFVKIATTAVDGVATISFGSTGLTPSTATAGTVSVAGTLITTNGGTGLTSYTAGDIAYYASGTALSKLGIGSSKTILTSSGTAPQWSASLDTSQGGTGLTTFTAGDLVYFASGTSFTKLGIGTNGQVLTSSGTAPQWSAASSVGVTTISFGSTGLTPSTATSGAVSVAGTLALTNGGTGGTSVATAQTSLQVDPAGTAVAMAIALG